ncbi:phage tail protein [Lactococcus garvieae]|uniref:phage tail protein n=1 Tax=Lactococcus garvieae TaxID=1363 RepID=UPI0002E19474|nr:phage tail protein [Lactococcus garvieae]
MNFTKYPYFQFNGRKSNEMNMLILDDMEFVIPESVFDFQSVDGRSSDIIFDKNKLNDIEKAFPVRIYKSQKEKIPKQLRDIASWLHQPKKYSSLVFSGYEDYYYKALYYTSVKAPDVDRRWLDVSLVFKCQPFMFRLDGKDVREVESGTALTNPEPFESLPLITFNKTTATADSTLYINGEQYTIAKEAGIGIITIDSESGVAYKDGGVNVSKYCLINGNGYHPITLQPGRNEISYNNMNQFKIKPRWRNLAI